MGACESEKQRRDRWLLHVHRLAPPRLGYGKEHGNPAADRVDLPPGVVDVCDRQPRYPDT